MFDLEESRHGLHGMARMCSTHKYTELCFVFIAIAIHVKITTLMVILRLGAQA